MTHCVLITGGSFGLGLAMAREFLALGHKVVGVGRNTERLAAAKKANRELVTLQADITKPADRERMLAEGEKALGPIDILVNNAAIVHAHDYTHRATLAADRAREEIETNFVAPLEIIRLYLKQRMDTGRAHMPAKIVNVSTPGALFPLEANPLYVSTKAGFHMFTLTLQRQLRGTAVQVIETFPPSLDTGLTDELIVDSQAAHGPDVIAAVAKRSVDGILTGEATILPHEQAVQLVAAIGGNVEAIADMANQGVRRRPGWEKRLG